MNYRKEKERYEKDDYYRDKEVGEELSAGSIILYALLSMMLIGIMFFLAVA
jgi:hypothetical protein